ncbi:hypothetical protein BDY19DRAFT_871603, partial [Irpex rosettiformis]
PLEYDSREHVERIGEWVGSRLQDLWKAHATLPDKSPHSKSWWSRECSTRMKEIRALRLERRRVATERRQCQRRESREPAETGGLSIRELSIQLAHIAHHIDKATRRLKGAVRRAKREFFDNIIKKTHTKRIWDLVQWTKPRKMNTSTGLVDDENKPINEPEKLAKVFQEQFTPSNPKQVDPSIIDSIPQAEERSFPPISEREIRETLKDTSNFSAPGPDHLSWFW